MGKDEEKLKELLLQIETLAGKEAPDLKALIQKKNEILDLFRAREEK